MVTKSFIMNNDQKTTLFRGVCFSVPIDTELSWNNLGFGLKGINSIKGISKVGEVSWGWPESSCHVVSH